MSITTFPLNPLGSLKASRRRPVSVDTDMNPNPLRISTGGTVGPLTMSGLREAVGMDREDGHDRLYDSLMGSSPTGGGGGGGHVTGFSNRNSHPFTEREVEQNFQQMEGEERVIEYGCGICFGVVW